MYVLINDKNPMLKGMKSRVNCTRVHPNADCENYSKTMQRRWCTTNKLVRAHPVALHLLWQLKESKHLLPFFLSVADWPLVISLPMLLSNRFEHSENSMALTSNSSLGSHRITKQLFHPCQESSLVDIHCGPSVRQARGEPLCVGCLNN